MQEVEVELRVGSAAGESLHTDADAAGEMPFVMDRSDGIVVVGVEPEVDHGQRQPSHAIR